jgi:transcription antitermination factor NusG
VLLQPKHMDEIRRFERRMAIEHPRRFKLNQRVRIRSGHLELWEGLVGSLDSHARLTILLDVLGRMVPVEFTEDQVEPV